MYKYRKGFSVKWIVLIAWLIIGIMVAFVENNASFGIYIAVLGSIMMICVLIWEKYEE